MFKLLIFYLVLLLFLMNSIWLMRDKLKLALNRRRKWQKNIWRLYFILTPVILILTFYQMPMSYILAGGFGMVGIWFSTSQIFYANRHYEIPVAVFPISVFYFIVAIGLCVSSLTVIL